ncbi:PTS-dependent dihydroxyacetone kinase, phosphotransferase subunit dhaM [Kluyvera intermedia]|nr:PTS-dependent dihydroxyacetone kinase, phosphotransferase subunit dhaM [Kluyvera intermedia]
MKMAVSHTLDDLLGLAALAAEKYSEDIAAIFFGQHTLLDDPELLNSVNDLLLQQQCRAEWAWSQVMSELSQQYQALDDDYLQARYIDIEDILHRTLGQLADAPDSAPCLQHRTILIADNIYPVGSFAARRGKNGRYLFARRKPAGAWCHHRKSRWNPLALPAGQRLRCLPRR